MGPLEKVGSAEKSMDIPKIWNLAMESWKLRKSDKTSNSAQRGRKLLMEISLLKQYLLPFCP